MTRKQKAAMNDFYAEMEVEEGMEKTYSGDVDTPDNVMLLEDLSSEEEPFDEDDEYSEEDIDAFLENVNFEDNSDVNGLSFDDMMPKKVVDTGIKYQQKENIVTPHYLVIRELVERTPSVCPYKDCLYDGAKAIKYKNWHKVPESKRKIALAALDRHNQLKHKFRNNELIDKSEIPTSWLSPTL